MWVFCKKTSGFYSIGFIQGPAGVWCEVLQADNQDMACRTVNYLNGGNGFPFDLKPPLPVRTLDPFMNV